MWSEGLEPMVVAPHSFRANMPAGQQQSGRMSKKAGRSFVNCGGQAETSVRYGLRRDGLKFRRYKRKRSKRARPEFAQGARPFLDDD